jgi:hypothetical protein
VLVPQVVVLTTRREVMVDTVSAGLRVGPRLRRR